jgi:outer membrane receptor protein involved in Fe transport
MKISPEFQVRSRPTTVLLLVAFATGAGLPSFGQTAATPAPAQPAPAADAPIVLSPFTVATEKDDGFVASSSLAGGRLAGELKDTPVAYSVLTKDFIDALNLTDMNKSMEWMPNTFLAAENNSRFGSTNDMNVVTIRANQLNEPQRNFFPFGYNFDNFNVERMDLARGANAVLFGNGGFGGNPNSVTKRAATGRTFGELRSTIGSWSQFRETLDFNYAAGKNFAVRGNLLWMDNRGWRDRDFLKRKGAALAATWRLSSKTELRAEAETGKQTGNIILSYLADRFLGWDGVTTYAARLTALPANANAVGVQRYGNNIPIFTLSSGGDTLMNYQNMATTLGGNANTAVPLGGQIVTGAIANAAGNSILDAFNLPASRFDRAIAGSQFRLPRREFTTAPDATERQDISRAYTVGLTQQFTPSLFLDLAASLSRVHKWGNPQATRGISDAYIDINRNLPNGSPNPKFLVPYSEANGNYRFPVDIDYENLRAALGYVLSQTRWGSYKFNVVGGMSRRTFFNATYNYALAKNADPRFWPSEMIIRYRYYWDDPSRPQPMPTSWNYVDPVAGQATQVKADLFLNNATISHQDYNYFQASTAAKIWKDRINLLGAVRRDSYETWSLATVPLRDNATNWDGKQTVYKPVAPADYFALAYNTKSATGQITGPSVPALTRPRDASGFPSPQYAGDRFQDDYSPPRVPGNATNYTVGTVVHGNRWLSAFLNYSTTFNLPPISGFRLDRSVAPGVEAKGRDYGLRFTFLDGKVVANLTKYKGESVGYSRGAYNDNAGPYINNILQARAMGVTSSSAINSRGAQLLPLGFYDSRKVENHGYELDITANLTRSWRLLLNGGIPHGYFSNQNPESHAWLAANDRLLRDILGDAGVLVNAQNVAAVNPAIPSGNLSLDANNAALGWNNIQNVLAAQSIDQVPYNGSNVVTANLFTDYTIREGRLRNLRLGGGVNFRGRRIIGDRSADTKVDPANPTQAIRDTNLTALNSVFTDAYFTGTFTLAYSHKINRRYTLLTDLRVENVFNYSKPVYYNTALRPPGGVLTNPARVATPNMFGYVTPRSYSLSATLKF